MSRILLTLSVSFGNKSTAFIIITLKWLLEVGSSGVTKYKEYFMAKKKKKAAPKKKKKAAPKKKKKKAARKKKRR